MPQPDQLHDDLAYVRGALQRSRRDLGVAPIYFLWALIVAAGFALADFQPQLALPFWIGAGIGGGALSIWLGMRDARRREISDPSRGLREGLHWLSTGVAAGAVMLATGEAGLSEGTHAAALLAVVGLAYWLAGLHMHPPLRWAGAAMLCAAYAVLLLPLPYPWTLTGAAVALSLVVGGLAALRERRQRE
jgi:hypothetical protein